MITTGTARDAAGGIEVEVGPGGGMHSLTITDRAIRQYGDGLAAAILRLVDTATAQANRRAALAMPDADLHAVGLTADPALTETIEQTTPDVWMT